jgi:hypothetical protein
MFFFLLFISLLILIGGIALLNLDGNVDVSNSFDTDSQLSSTYLLPNSFFLYSFISEEIKISFGGDSLIQFYTRDIVKDKPVSVVTEDIDFLDESSFFFFLKPLFVLGYVFDISPYSIVEYLPSREFKNKNMPCITGIFADENQKYTLFSSDREFVIRFYDNV